MELSATQRAELHESLVALEQELRAHLDGTKLGAETVDLDKPIGRLSRMDQLQAQQMAKAQIRRAEIRLRQVEAALEDMAQDEYGYCSRCDEPIGYKRLRARPEARVCIDCQSQLE